MYHKYHISCVCMNYWGMSKAQTIFAFSHYESPLDSLDARWLRVTPTNCEKAQGPGRSQRGWVIASSMEAELRKDGVSKNAKHSRIGFAGANAASFISLTRFGSGLLRGQCHQTKTMLRISSTHAIRKMHTIILRRGIRHQLECMKRVNHHHALYILWLAWCMQQLLLWTSGFRYISSSEDSLKTAVAVLYTFTFDG